MMQIRIATFAIGSIEADQSTEKATFGLEGQVIDIDEYLGPSIFHGAGANVRFDAETLRSGIQAQAPELDEYALGYVQTRANLEPKLHEYDDEVTFEQPIFVRAKVGDGTLDRLRTLVTLSAHNQQELYLFIEFTHKELPQPRTVLGVVSLDELDVSREFVYALRRFSIGAARQISALTQV